MLEPSLHLFAQAMTAGPLCYGLDLYLIACLSASNLVMQNLYNCNCVMVHPCYRMLIRTGHSPRHLHPK